MTLLAEKPALPPLRLPRYTFIVSGTKHERADLASLIADRDPQMLVDSLHYPLSQATAVLFFESRSPNVDLVLRGPLPFRHPMGDAQDFIVSLKEAVLGFGGPLALCDLAIPRIADAQDFASRFLIPDCTPGDAEFFTNAFGGAHCLWLWIGQKPNLVNPAFNIDVYGPVEAQFAQVEQSVEHLPL